MARYQSCGRKGKLTTARRKKLPAKVFGLPRERKYPITSVSHARNAKARAKQQYEKGNLSYRKYMQVVARANAYIKKCTGAVCRGATCSMPVKKATVSKSEEKRRLNAALKGV